MKETLKQILNGKLKPTEALRQLGATADIWLIEHSDTHTTVDIGKVYKSMAREDVAWWLEQYKEDNPTKHIVVHTIDRKEYERLSAQFEAEY